MAAQWRFSVTNISMVLVWKRKSLSSASEMGSVCLEHWGTGLSNRCSVFIGVHPGCVGCTSYVVYRLLQSLSLVAVGLSVGYETWLVLSAVWLADLNIDGETPWLHWILGNLQCVVGSCDWWKFLPCSKAHWQSPCTAPTAGIYLPLGLCKETVKESIWCEDSGGWGMEPSVHPLKYARYSLL